MWARNGRRFPFPAKQVHARTLAAALRRGSALSAGVVDGGSISRSGGVDSGPGWFRLSMLLVDQSFVGRRGWDILRATCYYVTSICTRCVRTGNTHLRPLAQTPRRWRGQEGAAAGRSAISPTSHSRPGKCWKRKGGHPVADDGGLMRPSAQEQRASSSCPPGCAVCS